ncbi:MAG: amino acid adenylation domain-containing protein [Deltaproteobacteria bacterium]|nr:MAG: amino acid adenylation domain-containing protein [Deltaproteobacteria bacterium]
MHGRAQGGDGHARGDLQHVGVDAGRLSSARRRSGRAQDVDHVIEDDKARFPRLLLQQLRKLRVAVTQFVPAQMRQFLDELDRSGDPDPLPDLRCVFNGGEALPPPLARDWFRRFPRTLIANA